MLGTKGAIILFAIVGSLNFGKIGAIPKHEVTCPVVHEETEVNILLAHESDCTKFYQCSFGIKYEHSCPSDLHFSVGAKRCEWPESANCTLNSNTCPIVEEDPEEDILLPHETDCTKFYKCSFGKKVEFDCPEGLHYNPKKRYCDWPANAKCRLGNGNDNSTYSCSLSEENQLYPHESNCNKYYQCSFKKKVERSCPENLHFNKKGSLCDWPENANCNLGEDPSPEEKCSAEEQNNLYAHKTDCNKFYQCIFGKKIEYSCPKQLHFNAEKKVCDWPQNAQCEVSSEDVCPPVTENPKKDILFPHESDCTKFYKCSYGKKVPMDCPEGLHYNPNKRYCDWPKNAECKLGEDPSSGGTCSANEQNNLYPHKSDCSKFYKCSNGQKVIMDCPEGLHYNPNKGYCDWPENANCSLGENPSVEETCSAEEQNNLYAHKTDCNKFYQCIFGKKIEYSCPKQLHFNAEKKVCDWPQNARCDVSLEDICPTVTENPKEDILFPHESDCTKFYKCSYGNKVSMDCPDGLHYNPNKRYCDWPNNAECKLGENPSSGGTCSADEQHNLYPHKTDCNKFYQCSNGQKVTMDCPNGLHYNPNKRYCDWPKNANCSIGEEPSSEDRCSAEEQNNLYPHKSDCNKFYQCIFGKKMEYACLESQHFNAEKKVCDLPQNAQCEVNSENVCPPVTENPEKDILFPHESDCTKFYKCSYGKKVLMDCQDGLHFNPNKGYCDWPQNAKCKLGEGPSEKTCSAEEENNLYPHKSDCNKFYKCISGKIVEQSCSENLHFSAEKKICDWPNSANCKNNLNVTSCPIVSENPKEDILLPHESDCTKFYKCSFGVKVVIPCPSGLHYNVAKRYCDWPRFANCDPNWGRENSTNSTGSCPNVEDDPRIDILLPHESNCTLFYKCNFGNKVLMKCPDNLHFNEDKQYCDYPNEANCKVGAPTFTLIKEWKNDDGRGNSCPSVEEDPEDDILLPHEFDCNKFYICSLGNKIERDCPAGLYFNPETNYCDWPENVECSQPEPAFDQSNLYNNRNILKEKTSE